VKNKREKRDDEGKKILKKEKVKKGVEV